MCGRYVSRSAKQAIAESFRARPADDFPDDLPPSWNVAPQSIQPVVRLSRETGQRELTRMRWGLIPFWARDSKLAYSTINARSETITTSAIYREAAKKRRCLIPADAFYEWQKLDAKHKQPYAIALQDDSLFAFAGLWESWKEPASGRPLETYTILTTDPNQLMETFHDRMPVILAPQDYERWLDPGDPTRLPVDLLRPYPAERMKAWRVSQAVGNTRNNTPNLLQSDQNTTSRNLNLFS